MKLNKGNTMDASKPTTITASQWSTVGEAEDNILIDDEPLHLRPKGSMSVTFVSKDAYEALQSELESLKSENAQLRKASRR